MTTVVVIGGGIAGYTAALAARRDGADVTLIARAPGATALYAGGMEIVDDLDTVLRSPNHPLTRLGMDAVGLATELDAAVSTLQLALGKEGLRFEGTWRSRGLYADIHGLARPANVVPDTVIAAHSATRGFRADAFVLATGRHIGGGLQAGRVTAERLFGLGIFRDGVPAAQSGARLHLLKYLDPAEEMRLGVMTDKRLHPLLEDGTAPYANLYAAGAVLGGYDYAGPCGFGVPILTGWLAGRYAAKSA